MARAGYVYLVMQGEKPIAGFTVRHELETWLEKFEEDGPYKVWRAPDRVKWVWDTYEEKLVPIPPVEITEEFFE